MHVGVGLVLASDKHSQLLLPGHDIGPPARAVFNLRDTISLMTRGPGMGPSPSAALADPLLELMIPAS